MKPDPEPHAPPPPLQRAYELMHQAQGHQGWWPGESPFEVCIGAILVQNTSWTNVERAIHRLKTAQALDPVTLHQLPEPRLAELIRPSGCFNLKAKRLRAFLHVLLDRFQGRLDLLLGGPVQEARQRLLSIHGIGPETADSMLLYAGTQPVFVIDAYARRIFARHGWHSLGDDYASLQRSCERILSQPTAAASVELWRDYHAQLVRVGKDHCLKRAPRCDTCPLRPLLPHPLPNP